MDPISDGISVFSPISITDFNGDGIPEVFSDNKIFSLATGELLCSGDGNLKKSRLAMAMDIDGDGLPELCAGSYIYKVNITSQSDPSQNSVTSFVSLPDSELAGLSTNINKAGKIHLACRYRQ